MTCMTIWGPPSSVSSIRYLLHLTQSRFLFLTTPLEGATVTCISPTGLVGNRPSCPGHPGTSQLEALLRKHRVLTNQTCSVNRPRAGSGPCLSSGAAGFFRFPSSPDVAACPLNWAVTWPLVHTRARRGSAPCSSKHAAQ